jgi:hypothetical protein
MLTRRLRARFASCYRLATSRRSIDFSAEVVLFFFFLFVVVIEFIIVVFLVFLVFFFLFFIEVVVIVIIVVFFVPEVEVFVVVFSDAYDILYFVVLFVFIV